MFIYRIVAHIDASIIHKLSRLCPSLLTLIASSLDVDLASSMASSTRYIFLGSHAPSPHPNARIKYEVLGDSGVQDKPLMQEGGLEYDSDNNQLTTYAVDVNDGSAHIFKRSFMFNRMDDSESQIGLAKAMNVSDYTGEDDLFVAYESDSHVVSHPQGNKDQVVLFARDEKKGWTHHLMETVEHAWQAVVVMFRKVGISIRHLLERIASKIPWDDISHTTAFLSLFYKKLAPISQFGIDLAKDIYFDALKNVSSVSDRVLRKTMNKLGVKDLNFGNSYQGALNSSESASSAKKEEADANTMMIHDRIFNNLANITMGRATKVLFENLVNVGMGAAEDLANAFQSDHLKNFAIPKLDFEPGSSFFKMGIAKIFNLLRSLLLGSIPVLGHLFGALMQTIPLYWNMALSFMMFPFQRMPFFGEFWATHIGYLSV
jgi:hypothetical protein